MVLVRYYNATGEQLSSIKAPYFLTRRLRWRPRLAQWLVH